MRNTPAFRMANLALSGTVGSSGRRSAFRRRPIVFKPTGSGAETYLYYGYEYINLNVTCLCWVRRLGCDGVCEGVFNYGMLSTSRRNVDGVLVSMN